MNTVFRAASEALTAGWMMGTMTIIFMVFFGAWTIWAWLPRNRERFEAAARLPLDNSPLQRTQDEHP